MKKKKKVEVHGELDPEDPPLGGVRGFRSLQIWRVV